MWCYYCDLYCAVAMVNLVIEVQMDVDCRDLHRCHHYYCQSDG